MFDASKRKKIELHRKFENLGVLKLEIIGIMRKTYVALLVEQIL